MNKLTLRAQMHAADGLSAEDAEALRAPLAAMTVRASTGSLLQSMPQSLCNRLKLARRRVLRRSSSKA